MTREAQHSTIQAITGVEFNGLSIPRGSTFCKQGTKWFIVFPSGRRYYPLHNDRIHVEIETLYEGVLH